MKKGEPILAVMAVIAIALVPADLYYTSRFVSRFKAVENARIITSNQLATAKIVSENLNHVRDLVYKNMEFAGQTNTLTQESILFDFLTSCVNDLKMKLISVKPNLPSVAGPVTTYGYDIQLEGDFFSFGEFCSKLENSQRLLALTSFDIAQPIKTTQNFAPAFQSRGGKSASPMATVSRRGITIALHLDTFRVKKGS